MSISIDLPVSQLVKCKTHDITCNVRPRGPQVSLAKNRGMKMM